MREARLLFLAEGWEIESGRSTSCADTAHLGEENLYLHPTSFSGVIADKTIPEVLELLKGANTFECYHYDMYDEYFDMDDEQYDAYLETKREAIMVDFFEKLKTKRSNLYFNAWDIVSVVSKRYRLRRIDKINDYADREHGFSCDILNEMIAEGYIKTAKLQNGTGYRAATAKELKALKKENPVMGTKHIETPVSEHDPTEDNDSVILRNRILALTPPVGCYTFCTAEVYHDNDRIHVHTQTGHVKGVEQLFGIPAVREKVMAFWKDTPSVIIRNYSLGDGEEADMPVEELYRLTEFGFKKLVLTGAIRKEPEQKYIISPACVCRYLYDSGKITDSQNRQLLWWQILDYVGEDSYRFEVVTIGRSRPYLLNGEVDDNAIRALPEAKQLLDDIPFCDLINVQIDKYAIGEGFLQDAPDKLKGLVLFYGLSDFLRRKEVWKLGQFSYQLSLRNNNLEKELYEAG